jgi:hypothetical protein
MTTMDVTGYTGTSMRFRFFRRTRQDPPGQPDVTHVPSPVDDDAAAAHPELTSRLRALTWPAAPDGVRKRVLDRVLAEAPEDLRVDKRTSPLGD